MIKINLLKSYEQAGGVQQQSGGISFGEVRKPSQAGVAFRVVIVFILPILLKFYENHNIESKFSLVQVGNKKLKNVERELEKVNQEFKKVEIYKSLKEIVSLRLNVIEKVSKQRLSKILTFENLQEIIQERTWFTGLDIKENRLVIKGKYISDNDLNKLVKELGTSVFFSGVKVSTFERTSGVAKNFVITTNLERVN